MDFDKRVLFIFLMAYNVPGGRSAETIDETDALSNLGADGSPFYVPRYGPGP